MKLLNLLDQISFKTMLALTVIIGLLVSIPVTIIVLRQKTQTESKAFFEKPAPIVVTKEYGQPSQGDPIITLVWPFLGKIGDSVLIEGNNFGNNPIDKSLWVGNLKISEDDIVKWTPNLIEFTLPNGCRSGLVRLAVAGKQTQWPYFFTIYSLDTKTQVTENDDIVRVLNGPAEGKVEIYFQNGDKIEDNNFTGISVPHDNAIISVKVLDKAGQSIPFFVDPNEFGF